MEGRSLTSYREPGEPGFETSKTGLTNCVKLVVKPVKIGT